MALLRPRGDVIACLPRPRNWPFTSSIRLNSSSKVLANHSFQIRRSVTSGRRRFRRRGHELAQAIREIRRDNHQLGNVALERKQEEAQNRKVVVACLPVAVRQPAMRRLELPRVEAAGRAVYGFGHGKPLEVVQPRPQLPQLGAVAAALDGLHDIHLAGGLGRRHRQIPHHPLQHVDVHSGEGLLEAGGA